MAVPHFRPRTLLPRAVRAAPSSAGQRHELLYWTTCHILPENRAAILGSGVLVWRWRRSLFFLKTFGHPRDELHSARPAEFAFDRTSRLSRNRQSTKGTSFLPLPFRADWVKITVGTGPVFWPRPKDTPCRWFTLSVGQSVELAGSARFEPAND